MEPEAFSITWYDNHEVGGKILYKVRLFIGVDNYDRAGTELVLVERDTVSKSKFDAAWSLGIHKKYAEATGANVSVGPIRHGDATTLYWFRELPVGAEYSAYECADKKVILCIKGGQRHPKTTLDHYAMWTDTYEGECEDIKKAIVAQF